MCGRFTYSKEFRELRIRFDLDRDIPLFRPRFNIAPGQDVPVIVNAEGKKTLKAIRWGLVPVWAKDSAIGNRMINARAETLAEKPAFKRLLTKRRCLVPADGFYEWRKEGKGKVPLWISLKSGDLFSFAGLWDRWKKPDGGELESFTIVTTAPNEFIAPIHNRMPVILTGEGEKSWLDPELTDIAKLRALLAPYPSEEMTANYVSKLVNSPANDIPQC